MGSVIHKSIKLTKIRLLGRFVNPKTGNEVNVRTGKVVSRGTDILFYLQSGKRIGITDFEFYGKWDKVIN